MSEATYQLATTLRALEIGAECESGDYSIKRTANDANGRDRYCIAPINGIADPIAAGLAGEPTSAYVCACIVMQGMRDEVPA